MQLANDAVHEIEEDVKPEGLKAGNTTMSPRIGDLFKNVVPAVARSLRSDPHSWEHAAGRVGPEEHVQKTHRHEGGKCPTRRSRQQPARE